MPEAKLPAGAERKVIPMEVPQSVATFGAEGLKRKDKDFIAAYVLNYIIGGGGFSSKLMEEVREKRGSGLFGLQLSSAVPEGGGVPWRRGHREQGVGASPSG